MNGTILAALIMFLTTIGFSALFLFPAIRFTQNCKIVKFYWIGFWAFLGGIAALSGAQAVLSILHMDVQRVGQAILAGVSAAFVLFVMFAWGRLTLRGVTALAKKVR
ncbi:MAG TPA: hypothetical protein ENJ42_04255 [Hellea balneolensis]|uniref:Uncharacterized protein n=1 Tax=Hellea balneolensis TaxID=287478 RepID=A0A7C5LZY9_9PROT|nr:hypothetical protein [Hellea balneolensis]